jgi:hypothetical protein
MWDCEKGDCLNIAESVQACPMCDAAKPVVSAEDPAADPAQNDESASSAGTKKGASKNGDS